MVQIIIAAITAGATIINTIISKNTSKKVETIEELKKDIKRNLDSVKYENDKTYLTDFLSELEAEIQELMRYMKSTRNFMEIHMYITSGKN